MEYQICKPYRNQNTEFIYRNHHARRPCLQRPVIAQPGTPCRKSGEYQKDPALFIYASYRILFLVTNTTIHAMINTTIVRMAVPKLELIPSMPTLPSMEVRLAKQPSQKHK